MITREDAEHLTCQEAAKLPSNIELEDQETLEIITGKALIHMAAKGELELLIDERGQFFFKAK